MARGVSRPKPRSGRGEPRVHLASVRSARRVQRALAPRQPSRGPANRAPLPGTPGVREHTGETEALMPETGTASGTHAPAARPRSWPGARHALPEAAASSRRRRRGARHRDRVVSDARTDQRRRRADPDARTCGPASRPAVRCPSARRSRRVPGRNRREATCVGVPVLGRRAPAEIWRDRRGMACLRFASPGVPARSSRMGCSAWIGRRSRQGAVSPNSRRTAGAA
jgi:hypothetical protein